MTDHPPLYRLTIRCYEDCDGLIGHLRRTIAEHLLSDIRMSVHGQHRAIEVVTDNLRALRSSLKDFAGCTTVLHVRCKSATLPPPRRAEAPRGAVSAP
jgi:hypothetical protein